MDYQSAKVAALMAGLEAKVTSIENDQEYRVDSSNDGYSNNKQEHLPNTLNLHGNQATANINPMILTNIQGSPYFKKDLYALKTFHEVVDEIYYKVDHLEPWERGSRKTSGQVGMCGGVRGVGAGGVASTAYCIMFKLFTMRITRRQLNVLLYHQDSPYIRGIGLLYIRYTQSPEDLFTWLKPFLDDEEEIDVKSGGGEVITIGEMARRLLRKLDWYATMFPRIPVKFAKEIDEKLKNYKLKMAAAQVETKQAQDSAAVFEPSGKSYDQMMSKHIEEQERSKDSSSSSKKKDIDEKKRTRSKSRSQSRDKKKKSSSGKNKHRSRSREKSKHRSRSRSRSRQKKRSSKERGSAKDQEVKKKKSSQSKSDGKRKSSRSRSRHRSNSAKKKSGREKKRSRSREHKKSGKHKSKKSRKSSRSKSQEKSKDSEKKSEKDTKNAPEKIDEKKVGEEKCISEGAVAVERDNEDSNECKKDKSFAESSENNKEQQSKNPDEKASDSMKD